MNSLIAPETLYSSAIEAIYDAAPDPNRWPRALGAIADYFHDVGAILIWHKDDGSFGTIVSEQLAAAQKDYEENGWAHRDLKAIRAKQTGYFFNGVPFADRHIGYDDKMSSHPCDVDFFARHGLGWIGAVAVSPDPNIGVLLSVQRDARTKDQFSDEELEALGRISKVVEKSLRLSVKLLNANVANVGLGEVLSRIGVAVFALDSRSNVIFSNPAAQKLVDDTVQIVNGRLRIIGLSSTIKLDEAISKSVLGICSSQSLDTKPTLLETADPGRRLAIYLLPIFQASFAERFLEHTRAIVLIIELKLSEPADPAIIRDLLGLTLGEARIAAMIGAGISLKAAAERLGIKGESARTVLKKVYAKTGISRQSELVGLLAKLVA